jgi:[CysO sulfur-carrier protein]-S-L-cysteine hydrolase
MATTVNTFPQFVLRIPRRLLDALIADAVAQRPYECCGLLAGRIDPDGTVADVVELLPLINELRSPTEFRSDPRSHLAAERRVRARQLEVLAVYHSHPTSDPVPSRKDRELNYSERVMNLIVGLANQIADVRGWWVSEAGSELGRFEVIEALEAETPVGVEPT